MLFIIFLVWSFWYSDARHSPSKNPAVAPTSREHSQRRYYFLTILCTKFPTNHNRLRHISVLFQFVYSVLTCYTKISFFYLLFNHTPGFIFSQKFMDHFFLFVCRTHAAQRTVDRVPCNLKRVVFESSQERFIRVSIYYNSIYFRESLINVNS